MKAVLLREFGGPNVLHVEDVETPSPGPGEVLVRVHSVSVNRTLDLVVREGKYPADVKLPLVLGVDPAGIVAAGGEGVGNPPVGARVAVISMIACGDCRYCREGEEANCTKSRHIGVHRWGGYAEYVAVPAKNAYVIPDNVAFADATVITRHFPMAFNLLVNKAEVQAGEWVLIMGAVGALGSSGIQVAKMLGARIIAGAGSDERVAIAQSYGADFGVNYRTQDLAKEVLRITGGHGADVVYENIADPTLWPGAFNSLAWAGRLVTAGGHGGGQVTLDVKRLYLRRMKILGAAGTNRRDVERALEAAGAGKIRAIIDRTMPLGEAAAAHRIMEEERILGKIILEPSAS
ncbi:MAG TPA: alcohol dehydrogenase catalytic domain-containing protein [Candidatus Binatia bacterium]|nr:alcohol dehydrogenase catalytic domain-containing protein [Candidatus Binatia bacterium]